MNFFSKIYQGHIRIWFRSKKKFKNISCLCTFKLFLPICRRTFSLRTKSATSRSTHTPNGYTVLPIFRLRLDYQTQREKNQMTLVLGCALTSWESERNTHRGLLLGPCVRAIWIREKYSQKTCTRTLSESYESERNTHRGLVLGRVWWRGIQLHCLLCTRTSPLDA